MQEGIQHLLQAHGRCLLFQQPSQQHAQVWAAVCGVCPGDSSSGPAPHQRHPRPPHSAHGLTVWHGERGQDLQTSCPGRGRPHSEEAPWELHTQPLAALQLRGQEQREALTSVHHSAAGGHSMMAVCSTSYLCKPSQFSDIVKVKMKIKSIQLSCTSVTHVPCDAVLSADHRSPGCLGCLCLPVTRPVILTWSLGYILNVIIFHQIHLGIILSYLN